MYKHISAIVFCSFSAWSFATTESVKAETNLVETNGSMDLNNDAFNSLPEAGSAAKDFFTEDSIEYRNTSNEHSVEYEDTSEEKFKEAPLNIDPSVEKINEFNSGRLILD